MNRLIRAAGSDGGDPPLRSGLVFADLARNPGRKLAREAVEAAKVADRHPFGEAEGEDRLADPMARSLEFVELASDLGPRHRHVGECFGDRHLLCNPGSQRSVGRAGFRQYPLRALHRLFEVSQCRLQRPALVAHRARQPTASAERNLRLNLVVDSADNHDNTCCHWEGVPTAAFGRMKGSGT